MSISRRRVRAIFRKELREYRRNGTIVYAMAILPLVFLIQPLSQSSPSAPRHPAASRPRACTAATCWPSPRSCPRRWPPTRWSASGCRARSSRCSATPIRREEFLLGKALAPSSRRLRSPTPSTPSSWPWSSSSPTPASRRRCCEGSDLLAQVVFTPLLAAWSIWVGIAISTRSSDIRVAQQLGVLASLPSVVVTSLIAFNVIHATLASPSAAPRCCWSSTARLADRVGDVRPRTTHHRYQMMRCGHRAG